MKILKSSDNNFFNKLQKIIDERNITTDNKIEKKVKNIIEDVKKNGDQALYKYTKKFDKVNSTNFFLIL